MVAVHRRRSRAPAFLAARASLALSNVNLHFDMQRQAITDDLTGLASHGRFQEMLDGEMQAVRRYRYPVGLIMLEIDDFKSVNDRYGRQQGDVVLRYVAEALLKISRDVDIVARYGGEEMALILPHTDLEGTYDMAERARMAIEGLAVPHSMGGNASGPREHGRRLLVGWQQERPHRGRGQRSLRCQTRGTNRTVEAVPETANVFGASSLFTHGSS